MSDEKADWEGLQARSNQKIDIERLRMDKGKVQKPSHYQGKTMEVLDVIEDFDLGFSVGNIIKYVLRAGKKDDAVQDLLKAKEYLEREIQRRLNARDNTE